MNAAVIDCNIVVNFQKERLAGETGGYVRAIEHILLNGVILLDHRKKIHQEWIESMSSGATGLNIADWLAEQMQMGKILIVEIKSIKQLKKIFDEFGLPKKDRIYIETAIFGCASVLVTDDIDFHDPKKKLADKKVKDKLRESKNGAVCSYLKKTHKISLCNAEEVLSAF